MSAPQCVITTSDRVSRWVVRSPQEIAIGLPKFVGYRLDGVPLYQGSKQLTLGREKQSIHLGLLGVNSGHEVGQEPG